MNHFVSLEPARYSADKVAMFIDKDARASLHVHNTLGMKQYNFIYFHLSKFVVSIKSW